MRWGILVLAAVLMGGCAAGERGVGAGLPLPPEPLGVTPRAGAAVPVTRTYSEVLVRAFLVDEVGQRREVSGAECALEAPAYSARFASPGRVLVPVPHAGAPAIDVSCRAGNLAGAARRGVVRDWGRHGWGRWHDPFWGPSWVGDPFWDRRRSGVSIGLSVGDPGWGWGPSRRPAAFYPDVEVVLQ